MTDPIDLADVANFDPIDAPEPTPADWGTIAAALDEAMKSRLLEYGREIV